MRSYRQYCALARALDVIGERWTLLIIRELFAGDRRYSDLRECLPGLASNLLADRLRQLQGDGVIETYDAGRPVRATLYRLTPRGRALGPALRALVSWGGPLVAEGQGEDTFHTHWMALGLPALFDEVDVRDLAPLSVQIRTGDEPATLRVTDDGVSTEIEPVPDEQADVVVTGDPEAVMAMLTHSAGSHARSEVDVRGSKRAIQRLNRLASRSSLATR